MAIIKCTECGKEVSDMATTCPSCGAPIAGVQSDQEKTHSVRSGAITGLIGAIGLLATLGVCWAVSEATPKKDADLTVTVSAPEGAAVVALAVMLGFALGLVCFVIGTVRANKLNRKQSVVLSVLGLIGSLMIMIPTFAVWNVFMLCIGWVVGWGPILMTIGSVMMLKSSLKMPK